MSQQNRPLRKGEVRGLGPPPVALALKDQVDRNDRAVAWPCSSCWLLHLSFWLRCVVHTAKGPGRPSSVNPAATCRAGFGIALRRLGSDHKDRTWCVVDDLGRDRAQVQSGESPMPAGTDDDQVSIAGGIEYRGCG